MSQGFVDDRSGAAIFPDERWTLRLELRGPKGEFFGIKPNKDGSPGYADLDPVSAEAVQTIITNRIITSKSNPDVFIEVDGVTVVRSEKEVEE